MIAYEIQLRYVIRDKIQSETKSEKKNFLSEKRFCQKKIVRKKFVPYIVSDFQCAKWAVSDKSMLIITKWCVHSATRLEVQIVVYIMR